MSAPRGDWMQTFTGRQFWPVDPQPADVSIDDIAHALSNVCRFGGHCRRFYSVAQHSVLVTRLVGEREPEHRLAGLLHDASEAYLGDMIRPLKRTGQMGAFLEAERKVERVIWSTFGLPQELPPVVKWADEKALATEARDIMGKPPVPWLPMPAPDAHRIEPWMPGFARERFLETFYELSRVRP